MTAPIHGEGLVLRPPLLDDRPRWLELFHDPDELRFGLPAFVELPQTVDDLDARLADATSAFGTRQPGALVIAGGDDTFLGTVGWRLEAPPLQIADVGYAVHPDSRGRGVATRALRTLTRWLTLDNGGPRLPRAQLDHSVDNIASCRTALAAGYEQEGTRRSFLPMRDASAPHGVRRHDVCLHGHVPQ